MEANVNTPSILDVVQQFNKLTVDDYQRTYAWTKDEIDEFFADLKETAATGEPHFFGTLILQSSDAGTAAVVDGQQRLTTTYVTVAALRDAALRLGSDVIHEPGKLPIYVAQEAWSFLIPSNDPTVPRFQSNRFLRKLLLETVLPLPDAQERVPDKDVQITLKFRKCVKHIRELIREDLEKIDTQEAKLLRIHSLLTSLLKKFLVLRVVTDDMNESLEIFLTLNNRGLPLGPSDLVRGEIMSARSTGLDERAQQKLHAKIFEEWKVIADNVEEPEVFLRHYLVATGKNKVTKKKVVENVMDRIKNPSGEKSVQLATDFWKDLIDASETYSRIMKPGYDTDMNYNLYILNGLLKSHRIFMLALLRSDAEENDIEVATRLLYVLCFRYIMSGSNAQKLEDFFQSLCIAISEGARMSDIHKLLRAKIDEANEKLDVEKYLKTEGDSGFIGKAILHGINRKFTPGALAFPLDSKIHLEHIAPQSETPEWVATLYSGNTELYEDYEDQIGEIGNLTLLDFKLNLEAQQKSFGEKKVKYDDSVIKITRDLLTLESWRQEEIEARTEWVAEMFEKIWHSTPESGQLATFPIWFASRS